MYIRERETETETDRKKEEMCMGNFSRYLEFYLKKKKFPMQGRERCDHYWPYNMQPVYYGDIQVTILNERYFPDWSVTEFRVCKV